MNNHIHVVLITGHQRDHGFITALWINDLGIGDGSAAPGWETIKIR